MFNSDSFWYRLPRVLGILVILFISVFALDAFDPNLSLGEQLLAFVMHMIPSFVVTLFLIIAWKWEKLGGYIFIAIGVLFGIFLYLHNYSLNHSIWLSLSIVLLIAFPLAVVGVLFLNSHRRSQQL